MKPLESVRRSVASGARSLRLTLSAVAGAAGRRSPSELSALVKEGSPLEALIRGVLSAAFWLAVLAPIVLVPAYYLLISLK
jgi:hypothetical protein